MFIIGNLFIAVGSLLDLLLSVYMWVFIIAALLSWVNPDPFNPVVRFLYRVTEPVLREIRRWVGVFGGIDFSPLVAILAISFLRSFVIRSLIEIGYKIKGGII